MYKLNLISFLFFTILCANLKSVNSQRHEATLDPEGKFIVGWSVDTQTRRITFDLAVQSKGWVGIGISDGPDMYDADIAIGIVSNNGTASVADYFGRGPFRPNLDDSQDVELLYGYESSTSTFMRFSRLLDTGDVLDDIAIINSTTYLLYAYGADDNLGYHGPFRGGYAVNLLNPNATTV